MMFYKRQPWQKGQSLVETAIGFLFIFYFLLGVLDLGRVYYLYVALEDSAGEAAIFLAIHPDCPYPPPDDADDTHPKWKCRGENNAIARAQNASSEQLDMNEAEVTIEYPTVGTGVGNTVKVTIKYPFGLLTPIISQIVGGKTIMLEASATQTIMVE